LTVQEAAIIQTFPLNFKFFGSQTSKFKQIGNAVPCNLAYSIAKMMVNCLQNEQTEIIKKSVQLKLVA